MIEDIVTQIACSLYGLNYPSVNPVNVAIVQYEKSFLASGAARLTLNAISDLL
jgi:hypothetical protein